MTTEFKLINLEQTEAFKNKTVTSSMTNEIKVKIVLDILEKIDYSFMDMFVEKLNAQMQRRYDEGERI